MTKEKTYTGGCLCGAMRYIAMGPAQKPHTCSCKQCQRHSGALTQVWIEFSQEQVKWVGPGGEPSRWRSSEGSSRAFCPTCGSTLGAIDDKPTLGLALGTFDSPNRKELAPKFHAYIARRPKWWAIHKVVASE